MKDLVVGLCAYLVVMEVAYRAGALVQWLRKRKSERAA